MNKILFISLSAVLLFACAKDKTEENNGIVTCDEVISFSADILPLMNINCSTSGCHSANSGAGGYVFSNHENIENNKAIILKTMRHETGVLAMPLGSQKLNNQTINTFACWIEQGAQNN